MVSKKGKSNFLGFRYHPEPGSPESILSDYLGERGFKKEAMLEALRAYWLPLALKNAGVEGSELEEAAWDAVFTLQKQLNYICAVLDLDRMLDLDRSKLGLGGKMLVQQAPATTA
ncbi:MAG: hypothetical protein SAL07_24610, partial [Oscillatoria sp. PMC 1051.18]|nr:hypothetical protein [Oscillatoria sp. PMC 1051.18]